MKKFLFLCLSMFILVNGLLLAQATDPAVGFWLSVDENGYPTAGWQTYIQNGKLYGKMLSAPGVTTSTLATNCKSSYGRDFPVTGDVKRLPILGTPWLYDLSPTRDAGKWTGGKIIDVSEAKDARQWTGGVTFYRAGTAIPSHGRNIVRVANKNGNNFKFDTLEMAGGLGPIVGRRQYWEKATQQQASSVR
ncbi:MAG: DUF2147 domain-containing protein [Treponema sp.]|jgi:uncharacterized protein (DUF2147 family)|nr:DUF2147 domain-containing protein [Treponema sp.]